MFQRYKFVAHFLRVLSCLLKNLIGFTAQIRFATRYLGQRFHLLVDHQSNLLTVHSQLLKDKVSYVFAHLHHGVQYMNRINGLLAPALSKIHSLLYCLLRFDSKIVKVHIVSSPFFLFSNEITTDRVQKFCQRRFTDYFSVKHCLMETKSQLRNCLLVCFLTFCFNQCSLKPD